MANSLDISKALQTNETLDGTSKLFLPEVVSAGIREYFEARTPVWNQIRKEPTDSNAVIYREQLGVPVASFGAEMGALPAAQHSPYAERAIPLKSIYTRGEISGQMIAASRSYINILEREVRNHTIGMINSLETTLVLGDSAARPNEFDGINKWITNTVDAEGAPLVLSHLEMLMDAPRYDSPKVLFMNAETRRRIWSVLQPQVRFLGETEINGGFRVRAYNDMPIIEVKPNASAAVYDVADDPATPGVDESVRGANLDGVIIAANTDMMYIPVLQDLTYEELAHTRDSTDFILKMYVGLVVEGGQHYHAKMTNFGTAV